MHSIIISFQGIERSGALEARMRELAERLRRCNERITLCRVTVAGRQGHHGTPGHPGGVVEARIHLSVPGAQIHADSGRVDGVPLTDPYRALRAAYDNARRQMLDLERDGRSSSLVSAARDAMAR